MRLYIKKRTIALLIGTVVSAVILSSCGCAGGNVTKNTSAVSKTTSEASAGGTNVTKDKDGNTVTKDKNGEIVSVKDKSGKSVDVKKYIASHPSAKVSKSDTSKSKSASKGSVKTNSSKTKSSSKTNKSTSSKNGVEKEIPRIVETSPKATSKETFPDF